MENEPAGLALAVIRPLVHSITGLLASGQIYGAMDAMAGKIESLESMLMPLLERDRATLRHMALLKAEVRKLLASPPDDPGKFRAQETQRRRLLKQQFEVLLAVMDRAGLLYSGSQVTIREKGTGRPSRAPGLSEGVDPDD
jgi:hypothetical protein